MKKAFWEIVFLLMSLSAVAAVIAPYVSEAYYWLGWIYIISMLGIGVLTLYAEKIIAWCDKQLGINKGE